MSKKLRKTLPKELPQLLTEAAKTGDDEPVRAALERCLSNARRVWQVDGTGQRLTASP